MMERILTKMFVKAKENENDMTVVSRSSQMLVKVPGPVLSSCDVIILISGAAKKKAQSASDPILTTTRTQVVWTVMIALP